MLGAGQVSHLAGAEHIRNIQVPVSGNARRTALDLGPLPAADRLTDRLTADRPTADRPTADRLVLCGDPVIFPLRPLLSGPRRGTLAQAEESREGTDERRLRAGRDQDP
ncbi:hypothetical protein [Streptomyces iranensis]|uniref:hypothetical protein n=1 Tax=Streptomyces iranensis TaxID=576784 RepID=UPI0039B73118